MYKKYRNVLKIPKCIHKYRKNQSYINVSEIHKYIRNTFEMYQNYRNTSETNRKYINLLQFKNCFLRFP